MINSFLKNITIILILIFLLLPPLFGKSSEYYIKFEINSTDELQLLSNLISVANVDGKTVYAFANEDQLLRFNQLNYEFELLSAPSERTTVRMSDTSDVVRAWDSYPTYGAYVDMMNQFALDYPTLCVIENIGTTINGRALLYAKISDNVSIEENEPEVMYTSTMHGNETVGFILNLRLIDYLLTNYGIDSLATRLVDSCEIWINPNANPDGTYFYGDHTVVGARRFNANSIDLNRNFPDPL
ncbi:MAG: zinc carboxypeptidase, partial [candidate division Zixibacteria bacterium]|nr:zinc carboxypeptidase [candidate division Zixibacteria bacterium]